MSGEKEPTPKEKGRGIVRSVPSGDTLFVLPVTAVPTPSPPQEREIVLSNITVPRLGKVATNDREASRDEPFAWDAREFLRKKVIGKRVNFTIDNITPTGRGYGTVTLADAPPDTPSLNHLMVQEGWAKVHLPPSLQAKETSKLRPELQNMIQAEEAAKQLLKGLHNLEKEESSIRPLTVFEPFKLYNSLRGKNLTGVIEMIRNGSTFRVILIPSFYNLIVTLSGAQAPGQRREVNEGIVTFVPEPFYKEAKSFAEQNLLNREVSIVLEGVDKQGNFFAGISYAGRDVAEELLKQGFATFVSWSATPRGAETSAKLRDAEKSAKEKNLRIWSLKQNSEKSNGSGSGSADITPKEIKGEVIEVINTGALTVLAGGQENKITLSSIKPLNTIIDESRETDLEKAKIERAWGLEGKEFLRRRLIGQQVTCSLDYIRPAFSKPGPDGKLLPERSFWTVYVGDKEKSNIAVALVDQGLATVIQHRGDELRSREYDLLVIAENNAKSKSRGVFAPALKAPVHHINDITLDLDFDSKNKGNRSSALSKAKGFLPFLQRSREHKGIVEHVFSGARVKIFIPKDTCMIFLSLLGVRVPKKDESEESTIYSNEALQFTRRNLHQRDVTISVDNVDKGGNFLGTLQYNQKDYGLTLIENGYAKVSSNVDRFPLLRSYQEAEQVAKAEKRGLWKTYDETKERSLIPETQEEETPADVEGKSKKLSQGEYVDLIVTEVLAGNHVYVQIVGGESERLEDLSRELQIVAKEEDDKHSLVLDNFDPNHGQLVRAKFSEDNNWYRAKITDIQKAPNKQNSKYRVLYVDYGNSEVVPFSHIRPSLPKFSALNHQAHEAYLAFVGLPSEDYHSDAQAYLQELVLGRQLMGSIEWRDGHKLYLSLGDSESKVHINSAILREGLGKLEKKHKKQTSPLFQKLKVEEERARAERLRMWQYGDAPDSDEDEKPTLKKTAVSQTTPASKEPATSSAPAGKAKGKK